jgi:hypothetical protein
VRACHSLWKDQGILSLQSNLSVQSAKPVRTKSELPQYANQTPNHSMKRSTLPPDDNAWHALDLSTPANHLSSTTENQISYLPTDFCDIPPHTAVQGLQRSLIADLYNTCPEEHTVFSNRRRPLQHRSLQQSFQLWIFTTNITFHFTMLRP